MMYDIDIEVLTRHCMSLESVLNPIEYIEPREEIFSFELLNVAKHEKIESEIEKIVSSLYDELENVKSEIIDNIAQKQYSLNQNIGIDHIKAALDRGIRFTEKKEFIKRVKYTIFKNTDIYRIEFIFIDIPNIQEFLKSSVKENLIKAGLVTLIIAALVTFGLVFHKFIGFPPKFMRTLGLFKLPIATSPITGFLLTNRLTSRISILIKELQAAAKNVVNNVGLPFKISIDDKVVSMFLHGNTNFKYKNTGIWIYLEPQFRVF